ncbi:DUF1885 family protein [Kroppenstedtia eburnea]|uniref:DUF1885 family protein n=1 Tax=Kroppenstedtia eburnea TaxID=714067 RepID=UPI00020C7FBB|nr:hypothetical protein HMPREF9374_1090 [Desmospora sp. 8437]
MYFSGGEHLNKSAYIKLARQVSLDEVKEKLDHLIEDTSRTGEQLGWDYASAAFPYSVEEKTTSDGNHWLLLRGKESRLYKYLLIGIGSDKEGDAAAPPSIQVVVPDGATHGDHAKANEICRFLAKSFAAELHLFNGRIMYYNPRKP